MTRFVSPTNEAEAEKASQGVGVMVSLDFASGFVRATNRAHDVTFGGNTYTGVGQFGSIEAVREDAELRPNSIRLSLSGVDSSLLSKVLTEDYHGRTAQVWVGWFNEQNQLVVDPQRIFKGIMDHMPVTLGQGSGVISVVCENEWARWARAKPLLYTSETQAVFYPTDLIFNQVPHLKNKVVPWGGHNINLPQASDQIRPGNRPLNRFNLP